MIAINAEMPKDCGKCFVGDRTLCSSGCPLIDITKEKKTNAEKFREVFGFTATELWAKPESEFLDWLNAEVTEG